MEVLEELLGSVCRLLVICEDWDHLIGKDAGCVVFKFHFFLLVLELVEGRVRCSFSEAQLPLLSVERIFCLFYLLVCFLSLFSHIFFFLSVGFNLGEIGFKLENFFVSLCARKQVLF